jgi:RNA polymerase sigma-70 factor (ECF subfamily)
MLTRPGCRRRDKRELPDADLLRLTAQRDDGEAFGVFYRRHQDPLMAFLVHQTRDTDVARDLVAETFAVAYAKAAKFDPERGDGRRWLIGIARVAMLANRRRRGAEDATRRKIGATVRGYSDEAWDLAEARVDSSMSDVVAGLGDLSDEERDAVVARVLEDRDYAEIARGQEVSEAAVRQRVSRGLRKLGDLVRRE